MNLVNSHIFVILEKDLEKVESLLKEDVQLDVEDIRESTRTARIVILLMEGTAEPPKRGSRSSQ